MAVILHYCNILDKAQWFIPCPQCFWRLFPSRWKHSWPCCSWPSGPLWAPVGAWAGSTKNPSTKPCKTPGLHSALCPGKWLHFLISASWFWTSYFFSPGCLLPPSMLQPHLFCLPDLAIGPLWPSKQGNGLAQPLVCRMDWNTEFALYLQSPRTIKTPQRGIVFLHFCYPVGWNPPSSELCAGWHLRTRPGLVPHVHAGHRCCCWSAGQPLGPSATPLWPPCLHPYVHWPAAVPHCPWQSSRATVTPCCERRQRNATATPSPNGLELLVLWGHALIPGFLLLSSTVLVVPGHWLQHPHCSPLVTSSASKFTSVLPEASKRVMEQVGLNVLGSEFHHRCYCNFRQLENCKLGPLSLRLCFSFYDPLEENEFPGLNSCL